MKKAVFTAAFAITASVASFAQVGINNTLPQSTLDIVAKTAGTEPEGIIAPRLTGNSLKSTTVYTAAQKGAIVYATAAATAPLGIAASITEEGYYYFDGALWQKMGASATTASNGLTAAGTNVKLGGTLTEATTVAQGANTIAFTGTAINAFSVNGNNFSVDAANGRVGIGTATPATKLEVNGAAANTAATAVTTAAINFALSNIATTTSTAAAITLTGIKDGGAYTLVCSGSATTAVAFSSTGFTFKYMGTIVRTASKNTIYSIIVIGSVGYVTMGIEN